MTGIRRKSAALNSERVTMNSGLDICEVNSILSVYHTLTLLAALPDSGARCYLRDENVL